jgi:hypothetical protein
MLMELLSSAEVAGLLSRNTATICRMAKRLCVGQQVGRSIVFTSADVAILKKNLRRRGNPNFVRGNKFGKV